MKTGAYFTILFMALVCLALTVALVAMGYINQQQQTKLQTQQQVLNNGILGPQAQQVSSSLIQSLADAAVKDLELRQLMEKHGYRITAPDAPASTGTLDKPKTPVTDAAEQTDQNTADIKNKSKAIEVLK